MNIQNKPLRGFYILFLTEVWERFGFYAINSLLILYVTKTLSYSDNQAYALFSAFSALLYVTPALGGYLADHFLGYQRTLIMGLVFLCLGYVILILPGNGYLHLALALIIVGTGFFKTMPYALLTQLYETEHLQIDARFTFYYLSINIGSIVSLLSSGYIATHLGWHIAFGMAVLGICLGIATFVGYRKYLHHVDNPCGKIRVPLHTLIKLLIATAVCLILCAYLIQWLTFTYGLVSAISIGLLGYLIFSMRDFDKATRYKMCIAFLLTAVGVVFFALYYQQPMSLTLFIDRNVDRHILGIDIPTASFWVFNPIWILLLGPCLGYVYTRLAEQQRDLSIATKIALGIVLMSIGYFIIVYGTHFANARGQISPWWIVLSYAFQSAAELMVSALGTAMIAKLAPESCLSLMMGIWFLGAALGGLLAGNLAKLSNITNLETAHLNTLPLYAHAFWIFGIISLCVGLMAFLLVPFMRKYC